MGTWHFIAGLDNHLETMLYSLTLISLWVAIYTFPKNKKKKKNNIFYGSIRFVFETAFTSEQIAENRFGGLLEISDKFVTKFNVLAVWFCRWGLNSLENFKIILYEKNSG